jgi:phage/plasmid-associated DNA primase
MNAKYDITVLDMHNSSEGLNDTHSGLDLRMKHSFKNFSLLKNDLFTEILDQERGSMKVVRASEADIANLLVEKTSVSTVRYDTEEGLWYIYDSSRGCFKEVHKDTIESMIAYLLKTVTSKYMSSIVIRGIASNLKMHNSVTVHQKSSYDRFIIFKDGIFDLATGLSFPHTPRIFVTEGKLIPMFMPDWADKMNIKHMANFFSFMMSFTDSNVETFSVLRFIMKTLFIPRQFSKILIISGYSGTGKSAFVRLLQSLVGMHASISTSFKLLKDSRFETSMFKDKKLVIFSDTEISETDMSVLKDMSGGDGIAGEEKHKTRKADFFFTGLIVIITNDNVVEKIQKDVSGALRRRIVLLKTVPFEGNRITLLDRPTTQPVGVLAKELSHILRWVLTMDNLVGQHLLDHKKFMFDASHTYKSRHPAFGHVMSFFVDNFIVHRSARAMLGWDSNSEGIHSRWLSYVDTNKIVCPDLSSKIFQDILWQIFSVLNLENKIHTKKTSDGKCYEGIRLLDPSFETSNIKLIQEELSHTQLSTDYPTMSHEDFFMLYTETKKTSLFLNEDVELLELTGPSLTFEKLPEYSNPMVGLPQSCHISFPWVQRPIEPYKELYHLSTEREKLSTISKSVVNHLQLAAMVQKALDEKKKHFSEESLDNYAVSFELRCTKDLQVISSSGFLVYAYIFSKNHKSNRLHAYKHGKTIHSVTRICRELYAEAFSYELRKIGLLCVSIDVKACFFNLLIGLIPEVMTQVGNTLKDKTIWQALESDIVDKVPTLTFDKSAVKVCLYSKLFGAGRKTMINGIVHSERERLVVSQEIFEQMDIYPSLMRRATEIVDACEGTDIFMSLTKAKKVIKDYVQTSLTDKKLTGPAGLVVDFNELPFNSGVSCFLQDYEISIVANLGLYLKKEMQYFEPCIHLHDGFVCVIKEEEKDFLREKVNVFERDVRKYFNIKNENFGFDIVFINPVLNESLYKKPDLASLSSSSSGVGGEPFINPVLNESLYKKPDLASLSSSSSGDDEEDNFEKN